MYIILSVNFFADYQHVRESKYTKREVSVHKKGGFGA